MNAKKKVGWVTMACLLMSDQIGYGILAMPSVYRRLGYVGATVSILILSAVTTYTGILLTRIRSIRPEIDSYRALFTHFFNKKFGTVAYFFCNVFLFFVICGSVLVQAEAWSTLFPSTCYIRWIIAAAFASLVLVQIRTLPNIGKLSIFNCILILVPNAIMLYNFTMYVSKGEKKRGMFVPFPEDLVECWVAVLDLLFSFAGHVVFFELMREMANPEEFSKSIYLSQALSTAVYIFNGFYVYATVGDATWMTSPANLSLNDGVTKNVCLSFLIVYFSISVLVDGTVFLRNVQASVQPSVSLPSDSHDVNAKALKKQRQLELDNEKESEPDEASRQKAASGSFQTASNGPATESPAKIAGVKGYLSWLLWSSVTMALVALATAAIGDYNNLIGIVAALVATQTSITWPCFFHFWMHERIFERHEECYYHGSGTNPCRCSRRKLMFSPRVWLALLGIAISAVGLWSNAIDLVGNRPKSASIGWFDCRNSPFASVAKVSIDGGSDLVSL